MIGILTEEVGTACKNARSFSASSFVAVSSEPETVRVGQKVLTTEVHHNHH